LPKANVAYEASVKRIEKANKILKTSFQDTGDILINYKNNIWDTIGAVLDFGEIGAAAMVSAIDGIGQALESLIAENDAIHDFFKDIGIMVADLVIQIGRMIAEMGAAMLISKYTRKEGIKITAIGAGLMTAGYIAKGAMEKTPGSISSVSPGNSSYGSPNSLSATRISVAVTGELDGRKMSIVSTRGTKMLSQVT
jgi:hypothetical protein